ncbi:MAG: hypothetical protein HYY10_03810 [Candidatus Liptonbacteria bacterium]|nr:hypothetical protein [Candidatus Liptonbacteria bacterium]
MNDFKINFLHVCENAFFSEEKKLSVIGIFDLIKTDGLPAFHPRFSIAINVTGVIFDKKKTIEIISPSGNKIVSSEMKLVNLENKPNANLVINLIGARFPEKGIYRIIFKINDQVVSFDRNDIITVD